MTQNERIPGNIDNQVTENKIMSSWLQSRLQRQIMPSAQLALTRCLAGDSLTRNPRVLNGKTLWLTRAVLEHWKPHSHIKIPLSRPFTGMRPSADPSSWQMMNLQWLHNKRKLQPVTWIPDKNSDYVSFSKSESDNGPVYPDVVTRTKLPDLNASRYHAPLSSSKPVINTSKKMPSSSNLKPGTQIYPPVSHHTRTHEIENNNYLKTISQGDTSAQHPGFIKSSALNRTANFASDKYDRPELDRKLKAEFQQSENIFPIPSETPKPRLGISRSQTLTGTMVPITQQDISHLSSGAPSASDKVIMEETLDVADLHVTKGAIARPSLNKMNIHRSPSSLADSQSRKKIDEEQQKKRDHHSAKNFDKPLVLNRRALHGKMSGRQEKSVSPPSIRKASETRSNLLDPGRVPQTAKDPGQEIREKSVIDHPILRNSSRTAFEPGFESNTANRLEPRSSEASGSLSRFMKQDRIKESPREDLSGDENIFHSNLTALPRSAPEKSGTTGLPLLRTINPPVSLIKPGSNDISPLIRDRHSAKSFNKLLMLNRRASHENISGRQAKSVSPESISKTSDTRSKLLSAGRVPQTAKDPGQEIREKSVIDHPILRNSSRTAFEPGFENNTANRLVHTSERFELLPRFVKQDRIKKSPGEDFSDDKNIPHSNLTAQPLSAPEKPRTTDLPLLRTIKPPVSLIKPGSNNISPLIRNHHSAKSFNKPLMLNRWISHEKISDYSNSIARSPDLGTQLISKVSQPHEKGLPEPERTETVGTGACIHSKEGWSSLDHDTTGHDPHGLFVEPGKKDKPNVQHTSLSRKLLRPLPALQHVSPASSPALKKSAQSSSEKVNHPLGKPDLLSGTVSEKIKINNSVMDNPSSLESFPFYKDESRAVTDSAGAHHLDSRYPKINPDTTTLPLSQSLNPGKTQFNLTDENYRKISRSLPKSIDGEIKYKSAVQNYPSGAAAETGFRLLSQDKIAPSNTMPLQRGFKPDMPLYASGYHGNPGSLSVPGLETSHENSIPARSLPVDLPLVVSRRIKAETTSNTDTGISRMLSGTASQTSSSWAQSTLSSGTGQPSSLISNHRTNSGLLQQPVGNEPQNVTDNQTKPDLKALARELYPLIKRMIILDKERLHI